MQYRWISLSLAGALALGSSFAHAADEAKPAAAKPATAQPAKPQPKASAPAKKPKPVDINSASAEQLKAVPGVDEARAEKIIKNRPYPTRAYLVTREVYSQEDYYKIKDYFVAAPPADAKTKAK
jgi:predicted DNA-binding helix-hairpin-helix protein